MEQHRMRRLAAVHSNTKTPSSSSSSSSSPSIFQTHKKLSKSHDSSAAAVMKTFLPINPDLAADIHDLSHHMSNLHLNQPSKHRIHQKLQPMSSELPSSVEGSKNTKSSQPQRKTAVEIEGFPEIKKSSKKGSGLKVNNDAKKVFVSMSKSQDRGLKEAQEGLIKRPSFSLSTSVNGGERRRSIRGYQTELADFFSCAGVKVVAVDMPPFMQMHAVESARKTYDSLEKFTAKTLALTLKKEFDGVYGPAWHCIVGTSFGSFVTHSVGGFLYFSMDHKLYILLFKTTVQRADDD